MYTPGDVSNLLGIPSATLRRYVAKFSDQLSESARLQRNRQFTETDVAILAKIRDLASHGSKLDAIMPQLVDFAGHVDQTDNKAPETALAIVAHRIETITDQLTKQSDQLAKQNDQIADLQKRLAQLSDELARSKRPWYKRILDRD